MLSIRDPPQNKMSNQLKVKEWKKHSNQTDRKRNLGAILVLDKTDFKTKAIQRDKEDHYIILSE